LTGASEVYIYAFGIAFGNKCFEAWDFMNSTLKAAMQFATGLVQIGRQEDVSLHCVSSEQQH